MLWPWYAAAVVIYLAILWWTGRELARRSPPDPGGAA